MMDARTKLAIEKLSGMHLEALDLIRQCTHLGTDINVRRAILEAVDKAAKAAEAFNEALKGM